MEGLSQGCSQAVAGAGVLWSLIWDTETLSPSAWSSSASNVAYVVPSDVKTNFFPDSSGLPREESKSCKTFLDLASEIVWYNFHNILMLWVHVQCWFKGRENTIYLSMRWMANNLHPSFFFFNIFIVL